ncbi:MAG: CotH kinase family protein [Eubacterium sp.]|nr:CotH kinase family protein [Muribaculaceae bacterium]MCM1425385.1 CotH kinase family protein [Eubacterium sp.]
MECAWHIRGNTTRQYDKSNYKLTLTKEKASLLGMRQDDDWILHSLYDDDGMIHNKVSYEVWKRITESNQVSHDEGIGMEYVELVKDGKYRGVYGISEQIDRKELDLNGKDILYKWKQMGYPGEDDFYRELTDDMEPHFVMKYPTEHTEKDWEPLKQWISLFLTEDFTDYDAGKALLNMENAIDYNLFLLLAAADDNMQKNMFLWADYQQDGSYSFIKVPWDLNMTWGNSYCNEYDCHFNKYQQRNLESTWNWAPDIYQLYLYDPDEIGRLTWERWQELRSDIITKESLIEIVDAQYQYLYSSGAYARNAWLWPINSDYWSDEYIYEYIDKRIDFLDDYIGQMGQ